MGYRKNKLSEQDYGPTIAPEDEIPIEYANLDSGLNRRQHMFIWIAVNNPRLSLVECASKAGYKDPRQRAYALFKNPEVRKEYNFLQNELKKKYELNYDRAVQDLYDIRDKALEAGSFNAAISAQNSLLRVGGLIVDRKEVMFGKIDQMDRLEVEQRLEQLLGNAMAKQLIKQKELEVKGEIIDNDVADSSLGLLEDEKENKHNNTGDIPKH